MAFPKKVKEDALVACGRMCCICHRFRGIKIEIHHIVQVAAGGADTFDNCIPLCLDCHADMGSYDPAHPKGTKYTPRELRAHRDRWYARLNGSAPHMVGDAQPTEPRATSEQDEGTSHHCADGGSPIRGILENQLPAPTSRCSGEFRCIERIETGSQLQKESSRFAVHSDDLSQAIARAAGCEPEHVEKTWSMIVGSPRTHLVVALLDGQLLVLRVAHDGRSFEAIELAPAFQSPPRCDTRAAATVDLFQDGEGQLLLASDGATGSGLGQTIIAVYRVDGQRLTCIFEEEISFNMWLDFEDDRSIEERSTTVHWARGYGSAVHPRILSVTTHTLGEVRTVRAVEYEWDGTTFRPANRDQDAVVAKEDQVRLEDERARLQMRRGSPSSKVESRK
jgi:hypothetical protein